MIAAVESVLQRYGTLTLVMAVISGVGGALWWVSDQTHRIKVNESEIQGIRADLLGKQDIGPVAFRLAQLEARWHDTGPMLERLTRLETQQAYLSAAVTRIDEVQGRMADRLNMIDRRLAETAASVSANQEIARRILEQQTTLITAIERALPGFRLQSEESRPEQPSR